MLIDTASHVSADPAAVEAAAIAAEAGGYDDAVESSGRTDARVHRRAARDLE